MCVVIASIVIRIINLMSLVQFQYSEEWHMNLVNHEEAFDDNFLELVDEIVWVPVSYGPVWN